MTSEEYWRMFHLVRGDIEAAIGCNATYLTIHRLGANDINIAQEYNCQAEFWLITTYGLLASVFMAMGRIFDPGKDAYSIQKVIDQTIEHPGFFNRTALRARKREVLKIFGNQEEPDWLKPYVARAWEPTRKDLELLRVELIPHIEKFKSTYAPIRNQSFAHRGKEAEEAIAELFKKTVKSEMADILRFLYTVIWAIQDVADNAI